MSNPGDIVHPEKAMHSCEHCHKVYTTKKDCRLHEVLCAFATNMEMMKYGEGGGRIQGNVYLNQFD